MDQQLRVLYYSTSKGNNGQAGDAEIDKLLDEARTVTSKEDRARVYAALQERFAQWVPIVPLVAHRNGRYVGKNVANFPGNRPGASDIDWRRLSAVQ